MVLQNQHRDNRADVIQRHIFKLSPYRAVLCKQRADFVRQLVASGAELLVQFGKEDLRIPGVARVAGKETTLKLGGHENTAFEKHAVERLFDRAFQLGERMYLIGMSVFMPSR